MFFYFFFIFYRYCDNVVVISFGHHNHVVKPLFELRTQEVQFIMFF